MDQYAQWTKGEYIANEFKSKIKTWKPENCPCKPLNLPSENGLPSRYWLAYVHRCYYLCFFILFYFIFWYNTFIILYMYTSCYGARHMPGKIATLVLNASVEIAPQLKQKRNTCTVTKWRLFVILILRLYLSWVKQWFYRN